MKNMIKNLFVAAVLLMGGTACAAAELGKSYKLLNPPQPASTKNIEVLEFFSYGCSHCFRLHPLLSAWEKSIPNDAELTYVPTIFNNTAEHFARTYYALESVAKLSQLHDVIYRAIHIENKELYDLDSVAGFVANHGVDREKFSAAYNSFSMQSKVARAKQMIRSYGITGTPTIIVDGKYVITGLQPPEFIRTLNEVIGIARKERSARR